MKVATYTCIELSLDLKINFGEKMYLINLIRKILILLIFILPHDGWSGTAYGAGGGGPKNVDLKPMPFPNPELLKQAVQLIVKDVERSELDPIFKENFTNEALSLLDMNLYIFLDIEFSFFGFDCSYDKLVINGSATSYKLGQAIYLSRETSSYSVEKLAEAIAQDLPHHFLSEANKCNDFANEFGTALLQQNFTEGHLKAVEEYVAQEKWLERNEEDQKNKDLFYKLSKEIRDEYFTSIGLDPDQPGTYMPNFYSRVIAEAQRRGIHYERRYIEESIDPIIYQAFVESFRRVLNGPKEYFDADFNIKGETVDCDRHYSGRGPEQSRRRKKCHVSKRFAGLAGFTTLHWFLIDVLEENLYKRDDFFKRISVNQLHGEVFLLIKKGEIKTYNDIIEYTKDLLFAHN